MKSLDSKTSGSATIQSKSNAAPFFQPEETREAFFGSTPVREPFFKASPPASSNPNSSTIQAKLTIGAPNDVYEQEADAMADKVVQKLSTGESRPSVQRMCAECAAEKEEGAVAPKLQTKSMFESNDRQPVDGRVKRKCATCAAEKIQRMEGEEEKEPGLQAKRIQRMGGEKEEELQEKRIQRMGDKEEEPQVQTQPDVPGLQASPDLESRLNATKGSGSPLPDDARTSMESSFGADFSGVRVHTNNSAVQMNQELGAQAFTHGSDIYFNSGKYDTGSSGGQRLLAHELTHTVQQGGVNTNIQADFAVEPTTPNRRTPTLTPTQIQSAIDYNQAHHSNASEVSLLRDILGLNPDPPEINADFVNAVLQYQSQYGLTMDGKLGHGTADRLAREIIAEGDFLGAGNRGELEQAFSLATTIRTLVAGNNRIYTDYKNAIQAATMIQQHVALRDQQLLRDIQGQLSWNDWAKCIELLGRAAPTYNELINNGTVRASFRPAWNDSNPAVNPPVTTQHEEGGWVFLNLITGDLSVRRQAAGATAAIDLSSPPSVTDSIVVAKFHTHPNLGPGWISGPSPTTATGLGDVGVDALHGVPDIVIGSVDTDPTTFDLFASGPNRRNHLAGNRGLPGSSGGIAPQAKRDDSYNEQ